MGSHHELGKKGEQIAAEFLRGQGHIVLHMNWRYGKKEIDIISREHNIIIFTEVKTRSSSAFGWPEEAVHAKKQALLEDAASYYLEQVSPEMQDIRFDIIAINFHISGQYELKHLKDVFS
ncbi:YraN family protein [uncultured Chitinophaga sp.]|uniref:YraN family protein n=1 Tax=uncultured Chitinophaga sp. TaxID=339340 RepID=UPI0025CC7CF4|nr:YraN family protein [uncultured Chitinophaga sp.]